MSVEAAMILGEEHWEIRLPIGLFPDKATGQEALDSADATLTIVAGCPGFTLTVNGVERFVRSENVQIRELNREALARLGAPIDVSTQNGKDKALESLKTMDPAYVVKEEDFTLSEKTLLDFINRYGEGYRPDHIGDEIL
jgi:predicted HAD superfamily phosphohydrolase